MRNFGSVRLVNVNVICLFTYETLRSSEARLNVFMRSRSNWNLEVLTRMTPFYGNRIKKSLCSNIDRKRKKHVGEAQVLFAVIFLFSPFFLDSVHDFLCRHSIPVIVWNAIDDTNSYVRASAIHVIGSLACQSQLWTPLLQTCHVTEVSLPLLNL